ncbi:sugar transport protein MST1-like [Miscanthus floridulus]|uniref:sugar transport protein MST1-like n=1 Tax=Miscanthus floridulus TaxID=154761 RepID=UPI003458BF37
MLIGGMFFLAGAILNTSAVHISMLIIGRILLGFAVAASPACGVLVAVCTRVPGGDRTGTVARCVHDLLPLLLQRGHVHGGHGELHGTNSVPRWAWRLSLGVGLVPAAVVIVSAALISDTPNSLVLRGRLDEARASLGRIRGAGAEADTDAELKDIVRAVEQESGARILRKSIS